MRRRQHKFTWIVTKIITISLPLHPFLGYHLGLYILFLQLLRNCTLLLKLGYFWLDFTSSCNCEAGKLFSLTGPAKTGHVAVEDPKFEGSFHFKSWDQKKSQKFIELLSVFPELNIHSLISTLQPSEPSSLGSLIIKYLPSIYLLIKCSACACKGFFYETCLNPTPCRNINLTTFSNFAWIHNFFFC